MLTPCNFISSHTQPTAYGRSKRAEKHSSGFTAETGTVSLSPPKLLYGKVMLASLVFFISMLLPEAVYKQDILEQHMHLEVCSAGVLFAWFLVKTELFFLILLETRNYQKIDTKLAPLPLIKTPVFTFPIRRNLLASCYHYCFHDHVVQNYSEARVRQHQS